MSRQPPPKDFNGSVVTYDLPAGTILSRVHKTDYASTDFNPIGADVLFGGGRFDGTKDDAYGYLYGGDSDPAAVAETLLRDLLADDRGARFLPKKYWRGRELSRVRLTETITLITIRSAKDLGAIGQDTWLTTCDADEYPQTRAWAHWLRAQAPTAAGLAWLSKREPGATVYVLFEDRCPDALLESVPGPLTGACVFEDDPGFEWLRETLAPYRVSIRR